MTTQRQFVANIRNDGNAVLGMWAEADKAVPVDLRAKFGGWGVDAIGFRCSRCGCKFSEDPGGRLPADVTCSECYADADQLFIIKVRWTGFCVKEQQPGGAA